MDGNKMKYVLFNLSYVGWYILAGIPQAMLYRKLMPSTDFANYEELLNMATTIANHPLVVLAGLLTIFVTVYVSAGHACFYDLATGNLYVQEQNVY